MMFCSLIGCVLTQNYIYSALKSSEVVNNDTVKVSPLASKLAPTETNGAVHTLDVLFQTLCKLK